MLVYKGLLEQSYRVCSSTSGRSKSQGRVHLAARWTIPCHPAGPIATLTSKSLGPESPPLPVEHKKQRAGFSDVPSAPRPKISGPPWRLRPTTARQCDFSGARMQAALARCNLPDDRCIGQCRIPVSLPAMGSFLTIQGFIPTKNEYHGSN